MDRLDMLSKNTSPHQQTNAHTLNLKVQISTLSTPACPSYRTQTPTKRTLLKATEPGPPSRKAQLTPKTQKPKFHQIFFVITRRYGKAVTYQLCKGCVHAVEDIGWAFFEPGSSQRR